MIKSPVFYRAFVAGLAPRARSLGLVRAKGGNRAAWSKSTPQWELSLDFAVNPKASAIPHCPGDFKPLIHWTGAKHDDADDGLISYYQYTTPDENRQIQALRKAALDRTAAQTEFEHELYRQMRDSSLAVIPVGVDEELRPNFPHTALYYLTEEDASAWGEWFGHHLGHWLQRFEARPETLQTWCWRELWSDKKA